MSDFERMDWLRSLPGTRVVCVGDVMLDRTLQGEVQRMSPEAPVPVLSVRRSTEALGGAAAAARITGIGSRFNSVHFVRSGASQTTARTSPFAFVNPLGAQLGLRATLFVKASVRAATETGHAQRIRTHLAYRTFDETALERLRAVLAGRARATLKGLIGLGAGAWALRGLSARKMDDFADCIINDKPTRVPGEEARRDLRIMTTIYEAARSGKTVKLKAG